MPEISSLFDLTKLNTLCFIQSIELIYVLLMQWKCEIYRVFFNIFHFEQQSTLLFHCFTKCHHYFYEFCKEAFSDLNFTFQLGNIKILFQLGASHMGTNSPESAIYIFIIRFISVGISGSSDHPLSLLYKKKIHVFIYSDSVK